MGLYNQKLYLCVDKGGMDQYIRPINHQSGISKPDSSQWSIPYYIFKWSTLVSPLKFLQTFITSSYNMLSDFILKVVKKELENSYIENKGINLLHEFYRSEILKNHKF